MNDFVEETDYSRVPTAELLTRIEQYADILRGATLFDLDRIMSPARELAARAERAEAEAVDAANDLEIVTAKLTRAEAAYNEWHDKALRYLAGMREVMERNAALRAELDAVTEALKLDPATPADELAGYAAEEWTAARSFAAMAEILHRDNAELRAQLDAAHERIHQLEIETGRIVPDEEAQ